MLADRVSTSCGYSIPRMALVEERPTLHKWVDGRSDDDLDAYRARKNRTSIDGLPAIPVREPATTAGDDLP